MIKNIDEMSFYQGNGRIESSTNQSKSQRARKILIWIEPEHNSVYQEIQF